WSQRREWQRYWLVDPLDGTREFIKRNGEFTVNIALIENEATVLGVVYAPVRGVLFTGGTDGAQEITVGEGGAVTARKAIG
ncbi:3'(2'),5'-bisphosphate nucleotidase CysQ family protein, partial [Salmonella enterica]|uniref:3'(2'),5'-bisphosphate nucleotidase CysQ family protein n=1 Tax=Salmonella enterica TaxID=28901 RepID=UPI0028C4E617